MSDETTTTAIIVFAREPQLGQVKTRLQKDLSAQDVLLLYQSFIHDVCQTVMEATCDKRYIFYNQGSSVSNNAQNIPFLKQFDFQFQLREQCGDDLGDRMVHALESVQKDGFSRMLIIGTDCLTLTAEDLNRSFEQLKNHDCVLGPTYDGGYYLIGLNQPDQRLFQDISWSTDRVFSQTWERLVGLKKKTFVLTKQEDIDNMSNLMDMTSWIAQQPKQYATYQTLKSLNLLPSSS